MKKVNLVAEKIIFEIQRIFPNKSNESIIEDNSFYNMNIGNEESLDYFLEQPPDTDPEAVIESRNLLGLYIPMKQNPGTIVLYQGNLSKFFWIIVQDITRMNQSIRLSKNDLIYTAYMIVLKTYFHEQFHYCCNVFREMFGSKFDSNTEEALAVAYSRWQIDKQREDKRTCISKIQNHFLIQVIEKAFSYSSPGYRDWHLYNGLMFGPGLKNYIFPNVTPIETNGIDLSSLLSGMIRTILDNKGGPIEKVG